MVEMKFQNLLVQQSIIQLRNSMQQKFQYFIILITFFNSFEVKSQSLRIELIGDSTWLNILDEIKNVRHIQVYSLKAVEGEIVSVEYFKTLTIGNFKDITFFNLKVTNNMLKYLNNIRAETFTFNSCFFEDSTINFNNKYVLFLQVSSSNINKISNSIRKMKQLRALTLTSSYITILPRWLLKLKELNLLQLTGNSIQNLDKVLKRNNQLKYFIMEECGLKYKDVYRIPKLMTALVHLDLDLSYNDCIRFKDEYDFSKYKHVRCFN